MTLTLQYQQNQLSYIEIREPRMVDSMHQPNSSDPLFQEHNNSSLSSTIEKCIGEFNWPQFLQAILISFSWFFDGQQTFITIFTDAPPPWHCIDDSSSSCINKCSLPKDSWVWDKPKQTSIISEWSLDECDNNNNSSIITGLPASMFFAGCLIGGLALATLADSSLGRKNMLLFPCLLMSLSSLFASFSSNVWVYSALKFLSGFGRAPIGTSALVLATELVAKKWRGPVGVFGFFLFSSGFLTLPPLAYANRYSSWRNLYLWTSILSILYCVLVYFFVLESPRWLLIRGRKEEAVRVLKSH